MNELLLQRLTSGERAEDALWQAIIACQSQPFYTASGLPFTYTVKRGRDGAYTGELLVSRKEGSKTLTRSSVMLAFHIVLEAMEVRETEGCDHTESVFKDGAAKRKTIIPKIYTGPKAIGQIFGISYIYSIFWKLGLIRVPESVEKRLKA